MKLNAKINSERQSRTVSKSGDEFIFITFTQGNRQKFDVTFDGEHLKILRYSDAAECIVEYMD